MTHIREDLLSQCFPPVSSLLLSVFSVEQGDVVAIEAQWVEKL